MKYIFSMVLLSISILVRAQVLAELDSEVSLSVGEVKSIRSSFKQLPIVEPHISAHPSDNSHLLAAAMVVTDVNRPYQSCMLLSFVSKDGGQNWKETTHDYWGYDPWTAINANGEAVLTWLGTEGSFKHQFPIQFFYSSNGGERWDAPPLQVDGSGHGHDGTKVTVYANSFYFTTVRFNPSMGADVVLYGNQEGGHFEELVKVDGKGVRLNFCEPAVLSDGTVIIPSSHFLDRIWIQKYDPENKTLSRKYLVSIRAGGAGGYMRLTADVSKDSKYKDRLYFVRALGRRGEHEGIWLNLSQDGGQTWSKDARVDLFDNELDSRALLPCVAINKDGVVGVSWVDVQQDNQKGLKHIYFAVSRDGGKSFTHPTKVTSKGFDPRTAQNGDVANKFPGGGHYLGLTSKTDGSFQLIWSGISNGVFQLRTCNVKVE